jgi:outer membrane protein OmpU
MKKLLLGTSALVAVGLAAGEALAQGYVGLGGFHRNWATWADHSSNARVNGSDPRAVIFTSNSEIFFRGETKLNNGLTFGFRVELEAWSQTAASSTLTHDQIDETWGYVKGAFGEVRFGEEDDARKLKAWSPFIGGLLSPDSGDGVLGLGTNNTYYNVENDAMKIMYISPSFGGFSFAASYTPDGTKGTRSFAWQGESDCDGTQSRSCNGNAWSIAGDYRGKFGDVLIGADIGYTGSENEISTNNDVSVIRADAFINIAAWEIGGAYQKARNGNGNGLDVVVWDLGVGYTLGQWNLGLQYSRGKQERATGTQTLNSWLAGGGYNMGGGVQVLAGVAYQRVNNPIGALSNNITTTGGSLRATSLLVGIAAAF